MTYDSKNDSYWIGNHGTDNKDPIQLIQIRSYMGSVISIIQIEDKYNIMNYSDQDMIFVEGNKIYITVGADYT